GYKDPRNTEDFKDCDICANDIFRDSWEESGVERRAFPAPPTIKEATGQVAAQNGVSEDQLVKLITDEVVRQMQKA
ncbi:MAG: class II aldolase/adducin family protein, partial [Planctomycetota bacterium]